MGGWSFGKERRVGKRGGVRVTLDKDIGDHPNQVRDGRAPERLVRFRVPRPDMIDRMRFVMSNEADTCRKYVIPQLNAREISYYYWLTPNGESSVSSSVTCQEGYNGIYYQ